MQELSGVIGIGPATYAAIVRQNLAFVGNAEDVAEEDPVMFSQSDEKIELNGASASELQRRVKGVRSVLAQRIEEAKPFHRVADLLSVDGVGTEKRAMILKHFYLDAAFTPRMEPSHKGVAALNIKVDIAALRRRGGNLSVSLQLTEWLVQKRAAIA